MESRDEEPLFPESLTHPGGVDPRAARRDDDVLAWGDGDERRGGGSLSARLDDLKARLQGKSPSELVTMARDWLEPRPIATVAIGFGFGFVLGRLLHPRS